MEVIAARIVGFALGNTCIRVYRSIMSRQRQLSDTYFHVSILTRLTLIVSAGLVASVASMAADIPETV